MIPLVLTCLLLFVMANVFPIVAIELQGTVHQLTLVGAVMTLLQSGMFAVALMVFVPTLFLPGLYLLTLLFVLWLTGRGDVPAGVQNRLVRMMQQVYPWSMVEVFLLGVLVAIIKLSSMASIIAGPALWAWMGTTITLTVVLTFRLRRLIRHVFDHLHFEVAGKAAAAPDFVPRLFDQILTRKLSKPLELYHLSSHQLGIADH